MLNGADMAGCADNMPVPLILPRHEANDLMLRIERLRNMAQERTGGRWLFGWKLRGAKRLRYSESRAAL